MKTVIKKINNLIFVTTDPLSLTCQGYRDIRRETVFQVKLPAIINWIFPYHFCKNVNQNTKRALLTHTYFFEIFSSVTSAIFKSPSSRHKFLPCGKSLIEECKEVSRYHYRVTPIFGNEENNSKRTNNELKPHLCVRKKKQVKM